MKRISMLQEDNMGLSPLNEAKVLQSLDHPNIIKYYETFVHNSKLCIVMEYADNGNSYIALARVFTNNLFI